MSNINLKYVFDVLLTGLFLACRITFFTGVILAGAYAIGHALLFYPVSTLAAIVMIFSFAFGWRSVEGDDE